MLSPEVLTQTVETANWKLSPSGVSCQFVKLDDSWGIKVYFDKKERDKAHDRQQRMSEHGYAPSVGICFDVGSRYCYATEVAETIVDGCKHGESLSEWYVKSNIKLQERPTLNDEINELRNKMNAKGYYMPDPHFGNFAWLRGNLVCIDFGDI